MVAAKRSSPVDPSFWCRWASGKRVVGRDVSATSCRQRCRHSWVFQEFVRDSPLQCATAAPMPGVPPCGVCRRTALLSAGQ